MNLRTRVAAVGAALATAVSGTALLPTQVDAAGRIPAIRATVTNQAIRLSQHTVRAGLVKFRVVAPSGDHELQLIRLHKGYSQSQFFTDINRALQGKVHAVRQVDRRVSWAGGAEATKNHPGRFAVTLTPGTWIVGDQNGTAITTLTVTGAVQPRGGIATSSTIIGTGGDRFRAPKSAPHNGWTLFKDTSDEPHFLALQRVKPGTTRHMITHYFKHGNPNSEPSFAMPGGTSSAVISGGTQMLFHYNLPRGRYAMLCFWPSDETGMPHAMMGMYRLINLR